MTIERKFIDLKALKVSNEGSGTIDGYRAVFAEIDEGGDLIVKGFFADSLNEYLRSGFTAHSHDWDFDKAVGFPVKAEEDDHGLLVTSQFHSTPDAQVVRTKAIERMEAGKQVGFSFGYSISDKSYIEAKDYKEQLPNFVKPERLAANLQKAQKFDRIRILKKGEVIEDSIVTAPMNKLAGATAVKSETLNECECFVKDIPCTHSLKEDSVSGSFESFEKAVSAIEKHTANMQRNHENRVKDGRMLSAANRAKVQACYDALGALLEASAPPEKETSVDFDMVALRTQSERIRHQLMASALT